MTVSLTEPVISSTATGRRSRWWLLAVGPAAGGTLGVVARVWMRLITEDPEFTWNGTVFIVIAFALTGFGCSVAWAVRTAGWRRRGTAARIVGAVLTLPLFVGAGVLMMPTVVGGSLARWRADWPRWARGVAAVVAAAPPVSVAAGTVRDGTSPGSAAGLVLFGATYAAVIGAMRPIVARVDGAARMRRATRIAAVAGVVLLLLVAATFTVGVATAGA